VPRSVREILSEAQRIGALGPRQIDEVIEHARAFLAALPDGPLDVVDLGTGAGLPGLVIGEARPEIRLTLVDRRAKRTDALERAIHALGWTDRARVVCADVEKLAKDPTWQEAFDVVVSRGFGPHETTLRLSATLARPQGLVVLTEPPEGSPNWWRPELVADIHLVGPERLPHVVAFKKTER
jgi:16S rRNA (guanine527-N7)-methyltransferase